MEILITFATILAIGSFGLAATVPKIEPRIINGYDAAPGQFPWQVTIIAKDINDGTIFCNGALISTEAVLTTANCLASAISVSVGLGSVYREEPAVILTSTNFRIHPEFDSSNFANNLAIIHLPVPIGKTDVIDSILLPSRSQADATFVQSIAALSGFGRLENDGELAENLQYVNVKIVPLTQCQDLYGQSIANENTLCSIGAEYNAQSACVDDFGAPLALFDGLTVELIGLASIIAGNGCNSGYLAGYTRVGAYLDWISDNTGVIIRN